MTILVVHQIQFVMVIYQEQTTVILNVILKFLKNVQEMVNGEVQHQINMNIIVEVMVPIIDAS